MVIVPTCFVTRLLLLLSVFFWIWMPALCKWYPSIISQVIAVWDLMQASKFLKSHTTEMTHKKRLYVLFYVWTSTYISFHLPTPLFKHPQFSLILFKTSDLNSMIKMDKDENWQIKLLSVSEACPRTLVVKYMAMVNLPT